MKPTFILIHGGFHAGWCWERLAPLLEAQGHTALAPDLPGMGSDRTPHDRITLASTAEFVADLVRRQSEPVILVGHSMGGMVLGEVAERVPEKILGLVFVTAVLMTADGEAPAMPDRPMGPTMYPSDDGHSMICDPVSAQDHFFNTTDPELAEAAVSRLAPQPLGAMRGPITATQQRFGKLPRAFVECTQDRSVPIAHQRNMQKALPCDPVFTLETDHSPFVCVPQDLSEILLETAALFQKRSEIAQRLI